MSGLEFVEDELMALEAEGLLRRPTAVDGGWRVDVSSNDYLGFGREPVSRETIRSLPMLQAGAGASRLIFGTHTSHLALEADLAAWVGLEGTLLMSSGYAANVGVLSALTGPGDLIVSDALNHASIVDGCRLSRAEVAIVPHLDLDAVAAALTRPARRRFVVSETYYSMDGDSPDLRTLRTLCDEAQAALILDEAHALGVFGPSGAGLAAAAGVRPDVLVGTLGKAVGLHGAFVASSEPVKLFLWNRARSFVYSTATSPLLAELARHRVVRVRSADDRRTRLNGATIRLRSALAASGLSKDSTHGPILPLVLRETQRALAAAASLRAQGILCLAIRPPTVPPGTARLRIALNCNLSVDDIDLLASCLIREAQA